MEVRDVNQLIEQFEEMKKMMKTMSKLTGKGRDVSLKKIMNQFSGGGGSGGFPAP
jgi:signal recognition particle subunit SRP54